MNIEILKEIKELVGALSDERLEELGCTVIEERIFMDIIGNIYSFEPEKLRKFIFEDVSGDNLDLLFDSGVFITQINEEIKGIEKLVFLEWIGMQVSYELYCIYDKISSTGIHYLEDYKDKILRYTDIYIKIADLHKKLTFQSRLTKPTLDYFQKGGKIK